MPVSPLDAHNLLPLLRDQRVKAIETITVLRKMGQEDFAKQLEQMVRENRKVNSGPDQAQPGPADGLPAQAPPALLTSVG